MSDDLISKKAVIALIDKLGYINVSNRDNFNANLRMDKVRQEVVKLPTAFDKEKVIEELKEEGCIIDDEAGNRAVDIIRKHTNDGWIPVEERLPEERDSMFATLKGTDKWSKGMFEKISDDVNVTVEYEDGTRKTISAHTLDGQWKLPSRILKQKVIAWCPYPEPYKKIQEENK